MLTLGCGKKTRRLLSLLDVTERVAEMDVDATRLGRRERGEVVLGEEFVDYWN